MCSSSSVAEPGAAQTEQTEDERDDASSKLSLSEKLALFNKLSRPLMPKAPEGPRGPGENSSSTDASERRRQKAARYRTQPITADDFNLVSVCIRTPSHSPLKHNIHKYFLQQICLYYSSEESIKSA